MLPANTDSPGCFSTGTLSPVTGAWFTPEAPARISPSVAMALAEFDDEHIPNLQFLDGDLSLHSVAPDWAIDIANWRRARVTIVTAYEPIPRDPDTPHLEELMARRPAESQAIPEEAAAVLQREAIGHDGEVLKGPAAEAILNVARMHQCELIVMGSRGRGRLETMLLGSVSQRVVQEAPCPMLIVR